jgi:hypothetical protein
MSRMSLSLTVISTFLLGRILGSVLISENWHNAHFLPVVLAQDTLRTVTMSPGGGVIKFTSFYVGEQRVKPGYYKRPGAPIRPQDLLPTPFLADDNWLNELSFGIQNVGTENVVYVEFLILVSDGSAEQHLTVIKLGRMPKNTTHSVPEDSAAEELRLAPHTPMRIHLAGYYPQIANSVKGNVPIAAITQCHVEIEAVALEDGAWWAGNWMVPDPDHPGSYKKIGPRYTPALKPPGSGQ